MNPEPSQKEMIRRYEIAIIEAFAKKDYVQALLLQESLNVYFNDFHQQEMIDRYETAITKSFEKKDYLEAMILQESLNQYLLTVDC